MMNITAFSFLSAILYFNLYIILLSLIRRHNGFILQFSLMPLIFIVSLSIFRLLFSVELPFTIGIDSVRFLPEISAFLTAPCIGTLRFIDIFIIIWLAGILYLIQNYIAKINTVSKLFSSMQPINNPQIQSCMQRIVQNENKLMKVKIVQFLDCTTPMIFGFFKPVICLPNIRFTDQELYYMLQHEWFHYINRDSWVKFFIYLISSIFWWNPFTHLFRKELNHILEIQCDLKVTSKMNKMERIHYLEILMKIVRLRQPANDLHDRYYLDTTSMLISTKHQSKIKQRFHLVLGQKYKRRKLPAYLLCIFMLLSFLASYTFVVQPLYLPPDDTFAITTENAYLKQNENGTYSLYVDGHYKSIVDEAINEPFCSLSIIE